MLNITEIEREVRERASIIDTPAPYLPTFGRSEDFARPHIEVDHHGYHWIVVERGEEVEHFATDQLDGLLYRVFSAVTFQMASDYELAHRNPFKDSRRILFRRQVELLTDLSSEWAQQEVTRHTEILVDHPFDDTRHT